MSTPTAPAKPGRPLGFCRETALDAAMRVFWEKGYEGATLTDLTDAMGINRSSMYAAFGNKETLFSEAIARYTVGPAGYIQQALEQPTARAVIEALLHGALQLLADPGHPRGCLSVQGALACGVEGDAAKQTVIAWRRTGERNIEKRFEEARAKGELPPHLDPGDLARYISTVITGLGIQAANGATKAQMTRVVDLSLASLPL